MEQRFQAVLEVQAGVPVVDVAQRFGLSRQAVHRWKNRYQSGGLGGPLPLRPHPTRMHQVRASALLLVLLLTACTGDAHSPQAKSTAANSAGTANASPTTLGRPGCRPPSPIGRGSGFPEVQGTSDRIQMWGLVMANGPDNPLRTNEEVKIVWRITGSGPLHLTVLEPSGRAHQLLWGPDPHLSSTYDRPGEEWGAGYRFTEPGCWTLGATRGAASADVWLKIAA